MKKAVCILVTAVLLCIGVSAGFEEKELNEAISLLKSCDGEPDGETREKLYGLGLSDEDIEGLAVVNTLRKDKNDIAPYIAVAVVITALSAAAVTCVIRSKKTE